MISLEYHDLGLVNRLAGVFGMKIDGVTPQVSLDALLKHYGIDRATTDGARSLYQWLEPVLGDLLHGFYRHIENIPHLNTMVADAGGTDRLIAAQAAHWRALFTGPMDEGIVNRTARVGVAHEKIGLSPEWYLGGYAHMLEGMVERVLARHGATKAAADVGILLRMALLDAGLSVASYVQVGGASLVRSEILTLSDMLEREASNTVGEIAFKAAKFSQISKEVAQGANALQNVVANIETAARTVTEQVGAVAAAADQLRALSDDIADRIEKSRGLSEAASRHSEEAMSSVAGLSEAADRIANVVTLIRRIASQTRMLSLNATIEAARAGDVGKGFAVVAKEVKELAGQTEASIGAVSGQAKDIHDGTAATATTIGTVTRAINEAEEASRRIGCAAGEQRQAAAEIARNMREAVARADEVTNHMEAVTQQAESNQQAAMALSALASMLDKDMAQLRERILRIVRTSSVSAEHTRVPVALPCTVTMGAGVGHAAVLTDLSHSGALVRLLDHPGTEEIVMGTDLVINTNALGLLPARVLMPAGEALHVQFTGLAERQLQAILEMVRVVLERDRVMSAHCADGAARLTTVLEEALHHGRIEEDDLFDENYRPIPGTDPQQYLTAFTTLTDQLFPAVQDGLLTSAPNAIFCCATDRNGYIATHNRKYSEPQRPDDPVWNVAHCRNRRIFNDRAGLLAAHNRDPAFSQTYDRDMGGGQVVFIKEVDCPIFIEDMLWGNLRLGYSA